MIDKEKVIKGLEFTNAMITFDPSTGEDIDPEALNEDNRITYDACIGAIALLKEQEKRINELEEKLRLLEYGDQDTLQSVMIPAT